MSHLIHDTMFVISLQGGQLVDAVRRKHLRWDLCGFDLCSTMFSIQIGVSMKVLRKFKTAVFDGYLEPPEDGRTVPQLIDRQSPQHQHAASWLWWLYWEFAEPLADTPQSHTSSSHGEKEASKEDGEEVAEIDETIKVSQSCLSSHCMTADLTNLPARHLPPGSLEELFEFYTNCHGVSHASRATFLREFNGRWSGVLKFRHVGQHARCTTCTKLGKLRQLARTNDEKAVVRAQHQAHVQGVLEDRRVYSRMQALSTQSCVVKFGAPEEIPAENSVLSLCIDGMDQSKFRIPRNLVLTKQFEKSWRPHEHCVGVLAAGVLDMFYLMGPLVKSDSSLTLSLLSHSLDIVESALKRRGRAMPAHLTIQMDNTARENRNQYVVKWASWLVVRGVFRSVQLHFLLVGHTHINVDQKFSTIATELSRQHTFEDPEETCFCAIPENLLFVAGVLNVHLLFLESMHSK